MRCSLKHVFALNLNLTKKGILRLEQWFSNQIPQSRDSQAKGQESKWMDWTLVPPSQSHLCWFYILGLLVRFYLKKAYNCFKKFCFLKANAVYIGRFLWDFKTFCSVVKTSSALRKQLKSKGEMCIVWGEPVPIHQGSGLRAAKQKMWFELERKTGMHRTWQFLPFFFSYFPAPFHMCHRPE